MAKSRFLLLIGNGLGRTISYQHFGLDMALQNTWKKLDTSNKKLLREAFGADSLAPKAEKELRSINKIANALKIVFETSSHGAKTNLLTYEGINFYYLLGYINFRTATFFHELTKKSSFKSTFKKSISEVYDFAKILTKKRRIDVATLNYDRLIYSKLLQASYHIHFDGFRDSFYSGFNSKSAAAPIYLPLHGTPLIYECDSSYYKVSASDMDEFLLKKNDNFNYWLNRVKSKSWGLSPIILNDEQDKFTSILGDRLLKEYYEKFSELAATSEQLIIFGYGLGDLHINAVIEEKLKFDSKKVVYFYFDKKGTRKFSHELLDRYPGVILKPYSSSSELKAYIEQLY